MRTLKILLVLVAVMFSGFSKDSQRSEAGVNVPIKFEGVILLNPSVETVCTPTGDPYPEIKHSRTGWLQGHQSLGGRLITEQSTWIIFSCETDFTNWINTSYIEGVNTVANGDSYSYTCIMLTYLADLDNIEISLSVNVTSGTGRFEGATGQITLFGINNGSGSIPVSGWGSLTFPKG